MWTGPKTCAISVIIPARDEEADIAATVGATARPGVEVVVADGGSRDRTVSLALAAGARVVTAAGGRGPQQNAGARAAAGEILLFLHADTRLPENFPALVQDVLGQPGVAAGAFPLAIAGRGKGFRLIEWGANHRAGLLGLPYGDQALFLRAGQFHAMGGFKATPLLEDVDLVLRLRRQGKIRLAPEPALTSARRWLRLGLLRTTLINYGVLLGYFLGVGPARLARWYSEVRQGDGRSPGQ